jgi:hypothetical protein
LFPYLSDIHFHVRKLEIAYSSLLPIAYKVLLCSRKKTSVFTNTTLEKPSFRLRRLCRTLVQTDLHLRLILNYRTSLLVLHFFQYWILLQSRLPHNTIIQSKQALNSSRNQYKPFQVS